MQDPTRGHEEAHSLLSQHHHTAGQCCIRRSLTRCSMCSVVRMKGEENSVMRDYVLPDFSSIKKGFCKVRKHSPIFVIVSCQHRVTRQSDHPGHESYFVNVAAVHPSSSLVFLSSSHERRWFSVESTRQESRSCGWQTSALLFLRCSSTRQTSASRRWASRRPSWTPSSPCQKVTAQTVFCFRRHV